MSSKKCSRWLRWLRFLPPVRRRLDAYAAEQRELAAALILSLRESRSMVDFTHEAHGDRFTATPAGAHLVGDIMPELVDFLDDIEGEEAFDADVDPHEMLRDAEEMLGVIRGLLGEARRQMGMQG